MFTLYLILGTTFPPVHLWPVSLLIDNVSAMTSSTNAVAIDVLHVTSSIQRLVDTYYMIKTQTVFCTYSVFQTRHTLGSSSLLVRVCNANQTIDTCTAIVRKCSNKGYWSIYSNKFVFYFKRKHTRQMF